MWGQAVWVTTTPCITLRPLRCAHTYIYILYIYYSIQYFITDEANVFAQIPKIQNKSMELKDQRYIRDTRRNSLICTCLIHSVGPKNSIIHPIHYSSSLHYQSAQRNKINPARNNSLWRDFFFPTKHLAGWVQVCTQAQIRVYEHIITYSLLNIIILSKKMWL